MQLSASHPLVTASLPQGASSQPRRKPLPRPWQLVAVLAPLLAVATLAWGGVSPATPPAGEVSVSATLADLPSIDEATEGMERIDGFVPIYWDADAGEVSLELTPGSEMIYVEYLSAGVGSNDIGLDRGQIGTTALVKVERHGPKVLLVEPNLTYRALSDNPAEVTAVEDAFARSVLWGFEIVAVDNDGRDGGDGDDASEGAGDGEPAVLVDATDFLLRDAHDVVGRLRASNQGSYRLDRSRSAPYPPRTKGFPKNSELEAVLTFVTDERSGGWVGSVTPTATAVTVRQHHSFVELPPPGYDPRPAHAGAGYHGLTYYDYATPIDEPLAKRFIHRHRLDKADPSEPMGEPVEPIIYYLDPGTPEPVRSALLDGARWWNQAFEAAGYRDAFRVEMLPEGADLLDVRYNVIQWVHRSTRGWSYGSSVTDPRTGEIVKGHVTLGSLRVRQDFLIAEGLLSPYEDGTTVPPDMQQMALARIRQLSAHEVGHTLGLSHNYIASTQGRASVMDYPHPLVTLDQQGNVDLSDAYAVGIGEWDKVAIDYGYRDFPEGTDEEDALEDILTEARAHGITFLSDQDARPPGSAHPRVHLWDNGVDAAVELDRMMEVRAAALERFGERAIREGAPLATMEEALVPLYLHHRYQVEAAAKVVGGVYYTYALRGDEQEPLRLASAEEQRGALRSLLDTLDPQALALPDDIIDTLPPRPHGYPAHRELFDRYTGLVFDPVAPAVVAADMTISMLLHPERAARLVQQHARDPQLPGLGEVIDELASATFFAATADGYQQEIARAVQRVAVERVIELAARAPMPQVRAIATLKLSEGLEDLRGSLAQPAGPDDEGARAHVLLLAEDVERFLERPAQPVPVAEPGVLGPPPGSPIGSGHVGAVVGHGAPGRLPVGALSCDEPAGVWDWWTWR